MERSSQSPPLYCSFRNGQYLVGEEGIYLHLFLFARSQAERRGTELGIDHELSGKEIYSNVA